MPGLDPGTQRCRGIPWVRGSSPRMTTERVVATKGGVTKRDATYFAITPCTFSQLANRSGQGSESQPSLAMP